MPAAERPLPRLPVFPALGLAFCLTGCVSPAPVGPLSATKFLHSPLPGNDEAGAGTADGRVGFSTGVAIIDDVSDRAREGDGVGVVTFVTEGWARWTLHPAYDLSVAAALPMATVEGNLTLVDHDSLRVGFLHGVGLSAMGSTAERDDVYVIGNVDGGVFASYGESVPFYGAVRVGAGTEISDTDAFSTVFHVIGSFGAQIGTSPAITPEVVVSYATWARSELLNEDLTEAELLTITPGVALSADF